MTDVSKEYLWLPTGPTVMVGAVFWSLGCFIEAVRKRVASVFIDKL